MLTFQGRTCLLTTTSTDTKRSCSLIDNIFYYGNSKVPINTLPHYAQNVARWLGSSDVDHNTYTRVIRHIWKNTMDYPCVGTPPMLDMLSDLECSEPHLVELAKAHAFTNHRSVMSPQYIAAVDKEICVLVSRFLSQVKARTRFFIDDFTHTVSIEDIKDTSNTKRMKKASNECSACYWACKELIKSPNTPVDVRAEASYFIRSWTWQKVPYTPRRHIYVSPGYLSKVLYNLNEVLQ